MNSKKDELNKIAQEGLKIRIMHAKHVAQKEKANTTDTVARKSYRLTERRIEWIYAFASDIPNILPLCPAVGASVGLYLPNQAPVPFVCMWKGHAEEGYLKFPAFQPQSTSVQDQT